MKEQNKNPVTVYFDGLCVVCAKEIQHYQQQKGAEKIRFVDITKNSFNAAAEGLDPSEVHRVMHVRRADGSLALKVDAFIEIWQQLPRYCWLARWASRPALRRVLDLGYQAFVVARPYLPRKKNPCETSPYCET